MKNLRRRHVIENNALRTEYCETYGGDALLRIPVSALSAETKRHINKLQFEPHIEPYVQFAIQRKPCPRERVKNLNM